jgi:hypothetical protein
VEKLLALTNNPTALKGFAVVGLVYLTWMVARHGVAWVWTKVSSAASTVKGWVGVADADVVALYNSLETRVAALEGTTAAPVATAKAAATKVLPKANKAPAVVATPQVSPPVASA